MDSLSVSKIVIAIVLGLVFVWILWNFAWIAIGIVVSLALKLLPIAILVALAIYIWSKIKKGVLS